MYNKKSDILKVAIAEDEPPMLRFLHKLLSRMEGFQVIAECLNAEEVIKIMDEVEIDLLISDIRMSGMDGLQLAKKFRQLSSDMHIIIVTGYKSFEYAKAAIDLNIDAFITKPVDQEEFRGVLTRIRENYQEKYFDEMRLLLEKSFQYNDEKRFVGLLSEKKCIPCCIIAVYYAGDMADLFSCLKRIKNKLLYLTYKNAAVFFVKEHESEEVFRYISVKFSCGPRQLNTVVCAQLKSFYGAVPTITEIKDFYRKQILQMVVPGSFDTYCGDMLYDKVEKTAVYGNDEEIYEEMELSIISRKWELVWQKLEGIFNIWKRDQVPASHLRKRIHSIMVVCDKTGVLKTDRISLNDQIDENIVCFDSYEEIERYLISTMKVNIDTGSSVSVKKDLELFGHIKELVLQNLEHNYSLQEICSIFKVSQPYVRKIFTRYTGKTYNDFILEEKIKYAVNMMNSNPDIQVKDLAAMLGYEQLYFGTVFKKNTGLTPSQYKQTILASEKDSNQTGGEYET